jgi:hypothetical protein
VTTTSAAPDQVTLEKCAGIAIAYDDLLAKAFVILKGAPHRTHIDRPELARISIEDDTATVTWPEIEYGYGDSISIETESASFPAAYLTMDEQAISTWKMEVERLYHRQLERQIAEDAAAKERNERAALAALKAKYEQS